MPDFLVRPCGDAAVTVEFGDEIDPGLHGRVIALDGELKSRDIPGVVESVPTYRSLLIHYDPAQIEFADVAEQVHTLAELTHVATTAPRGRRWRVPVVFGDEFGIDFEAIARSASMSCCELADALCSTDYLVYMIGFSPGFTYLGGLDPVLERARRTEPRLLTPASSITLGGRQLAIQAVAGPTGWHLLGQTPVRNYVPSRDPIFLFAASDTIRFEPHPAAQWPMLVEQAAGRDFKAEELR